MLLPDPIETSTPEDLDASLWGRLDLLILGSNSSLSAGR